MDKKCFSQRNRIKITAGCVLLAAGFALLLASRICRGFADWYSLRVYPVWVGTTGRLAGILPWSVSELLLYALIAGLVAAGVRRKLRGWLPGLFCLAAALFFLYVVNCGINYHKASFAETSGIRMREYTAAELEEVCLRLTDEVNTLADGVERDADGVMRLTAAEEVPLTGITVYDGAAETSSGNRAVQGETAVSKETLGHAKRSTAVTRAAQDEAVTSMRALGHTYGELSGYYPRPKGLLIPWILSVQQLSGIYSPFTVEANYNSAMPDYDLPFTMCHELSHLRGFMQEEEANFIAFLACRGSDDVSFRYSGALTGWVYCMNVLYRADYEAWEDVRGRLSPEAEPDLAANREFWARYDGAVAEVSNRINDTYLKANGQDEGVKSYDRMVDLIVAFYAGGR